MKSTRVRGRISVNARGFGFVTIDALEPEDRAHAEHAPLLKGTAVFVTPPDLNPFLDGDEVSAEVSPAEPGRFVASRLSLLHRRRNELFGSVTTHGKRKHLRVDRLVSNTDWPFEEGTANDLDDGTFVVATIQGSALAPLRVVPRGSDLGLERCLVRHGVRSIFSPAVLEAAREAAHKTPGGARRDLRAVPTVTIDAPTSTDLDDALSVLPAGADGALRVLVSIADVDAFVAEGSPMDLEARARGTSVYLAGRVIHMLPEAIASDAASLLEGRDRPALTVELRVDAEGQTTSIDLYESVIRSSARLDYESVDEFLTRGASRGVPEAVAPTLRWLRTAAARLSAVRATRGGVELDREEARITIDAVTREPTAIEARIATEAHRLVERLMVAANEAVAEWLVERGLPGVFRVHDEPTSEKVEVLASFAHNFGFEAGFGPKLSPRGLAAFEAQFRGLPIAPAIRTVLGKALGPARYTVHPGLHFGLAAPLYVHFTSPIRRYADLAVHRVVKRFLAGERSFQAADPAFEELSQRLNQAAYRATKAENERHWMMVARLFSSRVGERLSGNIASVKPFGLVVQMIGTGTTGTVALDALPEGPYRVEPGGHAVASASRRYGVGDPIEVEIAGTNEELGRVELSPVP